MPYVILSLDEFHELIKADQRNRFEDPDLSKQSDFWKRGRILAGAVTDNHAHIRSVGRDVMPDTAEGSALTRWLMIKGLGGRRGASAAVGSLALRVFGEEAAEVDGETVTAASGKTYTVGSGTIPTGGTYVDVDLTADVAGSASLLEEGDTVSFDAPPAGIEEAATMIADMTGGLDDEQDGPGRERLLQRFRQPALGGAVADFREWVFELNDDVVGVYVYPNRNGMGSTDVAALKPGSGAVRALDASERSDLLDALNELVPVLIHKDMATLRVLETTADEQDIAVRVVPLGGVAYEFDWNDSSPPTVDTWTAGTRTVTLTTDRPTTLQPGHRVTFAVGTGEQSVVESLSGTDAFVLKVAPTIAPSGAVYSGGPLVDLIRDALLEHVNGLGTTPGTFGFGDWLGELLRANLFKITQLTEGVLDSEVTSPAASYTPEDTAFPDSATIPYVTPGQVLVRRWWQ